MEYITLSNGVKAPVIGIGTFMISPEDTENSVYSALKTGYRMIDTANAYMNEEAVGKALAKAFEEGIVKREDVFVSTKLWPTLYENETAVDKTLERLGLDYVDLLFIHQPSGNYMAGYRQLEKAYKDGKARSLGISNFVGESLETLLAEAEIAPFGAVLSSVRASSIASETAPSAVSPALLYFKTIRGFFTLFVIVSASLKLSLV